MIGQTIGSPNDKGSSYSVAMFRPNSNTHHVCVAAASDEPHGANRLGRGVGVDQNMRTQESRCNTSLRFNRLSRFASVAELSASIAHQLSQPLTSMLANAQAAKRWLVAEPQNLIEAIVSIDRIVRDVRAAGETMQRIRALFKQEPLNRRATNIPDVISEAVRLVMEDPRKRDVSIRSCFEENLPEVWVDPLAMQELFINLISNALEALEDSKETALVKVHAAVKDANEIIIQVIDNGSGIGETDEIFDAFVTSKNGGLGIGLALSRSIAKAHGGRLWAENNPSGGATFSLTVPLSS
jgi:signal transduction histidine kinase